MERFVNKFFNLSSVQSQININNEVKNPESNYKIIYAAIKGTLT